MIARTRFLLAAVLVAFASTACSDALTGLSRLTPPSNPRAVGGSGLSGGGGVGGGASTTPVCSSVAKFSTSVGARNGFATVHTSIGLTDPCSGTFSLILVTITNDQTGATEPIWNGTYNRAYGFSADYLTASFSTSYTITVTAAGVTTQLPSVLTPAPKL
ncbi:MAG: hypothetical protein JWM41_736 [Gemmatimonadetes bacterium]|nr:hypothetical protein [Gemmatimonadota bacterium]